MIISMIILSKLIKVIELSVARLDNLLRKVVDLDKFRRSTNFQEEIVKSRFKIFGGIALIFVVILAACSAPAAPAIEVEGAWGRVSPSIAGSGAFYLMIKNTGGSEDKLTAVKSPACGMAEMHETVKKDDGTMGMNLVPEPVAIPANGQVEFKSGGMHVMCMMMKSDQFVSGNKVDLVMTFEKSGEKTIPVDIRDQ